MLAAAQALECDCPDPLHQVPVRLARRGFGDRMAFVVAGDDAHHVLGHKTKPR